MDPNEFFLGPRHKIIRKGNMSKSSSKNCDTEKCKVEEINRILSMKKCVFEQPHYERCVTLSESEWDDNLKLAKVTKIGKNLTKNFSHSWNKAIYLYPEECLCLLEMKCLLLKWNGKKLSIKNAYALLLSAGSGCTFEQFRTFGYLVKLGFRVFRHNNELKNNDSCDTMENLTKLPEITDKKYKYKQTNEFDVHSSKDKICFPELESISLVTISRPPFNYLPFNLQPKYDNYSFTLTVSPDNLKISKVISFNKTLKSEKNQFDKNVVLVECDSKAPTGIYPVYEKTTPKMINFDKEIFEPQVKRLKTEKYVPRLDINNSDNNIMFEMDGLPIINNVTSSTSSDVNNVYVLDSEVNSMNKVHVLSNEEKIETREDGLSISTIVKAPTAMDENMSYASCSTINLTKKIFVIQTKTIHTKNSNKSIESNTIPNDDILFGMKSNLPSHIRHKLLAIKPTNVENESKGDINNEHHMQFDVYYPDNNVPKKLRAAPDYRVIVFEDHFDTFPNIYNVNASNPNDNVPTLWAIVNSSSVSFYNVNNIILPKSTDWKIQSRKYFQRKKK